MPEETNPIENAGQISAGGVVPAPAEGVKVTLQEGETVTKQAVTDLPEWAQKLITDVRGEAAKYRTEARTAATEAQAELTDRIAKAFGLKEEAAADPEALAKAATEAQAAAQKSARELAIFKAASTAGADPNRLLGWSPFMSSVEGLDVNDGAAVSAAITAAISANPFLKAVQAAAASGGELGGSGEQGQITEQQLAAMSPEQITKAFNEGKLAHLLA